jgi:hypothetical protein
MFMRHSDRVGYNFCEVGGKNSISNTWLPKGHEMNIVTSKANLQ